jgi:Zn-dependent protease
MVAQAMDYSDFPCKVFPALMIFGPLLGGGALSGFLFGWAKPTPVITRNFKKIVRDDVLTTLAGPVSNLLLASAAVIGLVVIILTAGHLPQQESVLTNVDGLARLCELAINVNLALFFFNLLPFPPLDGSRILRHFLPYNWVSAYDSMGWMSLILMILLGGPIVRFLMGPTLELVYTALNQIHGG